MQPILVTTLLYAAFFFPSIWAWPLSIELILIAGTSLLCDGKAIDDAFLPRYVALVVGFLSATWVLVGLRKRLLSAELHQRDIAYRQVAERAQSILRSTLARIGADEFAVIARAISTHYSDMLSRNRGERNSVPAG